MVIMILESIITVKKKCVKWICYNIKQSLYQKIYIKEKKEFNFNNLD